MPNIACFRAMVLRTHCTGHCSGLYGKHGIPVRGGVLLVPGQAPLHCFRIGGLLSLFGHLLFLLGCFLNFWTVAQILIWISWQAKMQSFLGFLSVNSLHPVAFRFSLRIRLRGIIHCR